jgi:hypothetical protein
MFSGFLSTGTLIKVSRLIKTLTKYITYLHQPHIYMYCLTAVALEKKNKQIMSLK